MTLSIIIPAFNEAARLPKTLRHIADVLQRESPIFCVHEIIIADDGSTDETAEIVNGNTVSLPMRILRLPNNTGKGAAVRAGVREAMSDFILFYDADGATPFDEVICLFTALIETKADIAIGSRVLHKAHARMQWHRRLIGRLYHALTAVLIPGIADAACGCKLFRSRVAKTLFQEQKLNRFAFDVEVLALAIMHGYRIIEVPVRWNAVPVSKVRLLRDGVEMFVRVVMLYVRAWGVGRRDRVPRTPWDLYH